MTSDSVIIAAYVRMASQEGLTADRIACGPGPRAKFLAAVRASDPTADEEQVLLRLLGLRKKGVLPRSGDITARFEDGVLKPAQPLDLPANAEVRLSIARVTSPALTVGDLNTFLKSLPRLGDDAERFADDVRAIRADFPSEADPWD